MDIRFVEAENADLRALSDALDAYYFELVGEVHRRYAKYNDPHGFACRAVAYADGRAVGCGCWKAEGADAAEIKRIYILPAYRRRGVATALIAALERDAAAHGVRRLVLETARTTEDSAALYRKLGYREIAYYGSPAGAENCRCFEKTLAGGTEGNTD